jgi:lipoyl(octanoyl) transferase
MDQTEEGKAPPPGNSAPPVLCETSSGLTDYPYAVSRMEAIVQGIYNGTEPERLWFLEHPALYSAGTSANGRDLLEPERFPVYRTGRGGQFTYHGPGQRVAYLMLNLNQRGRDVRRLIFSLEEWLIGALAHFGVAAERRDGRVGIWVRRGDHDDKIAALGLRLRRWITFHGVSVNVDPDLDHFSGIVPCGVTGHGVTSLAALGVLATMAEVDHVLRSTFEQQFGPIRSALGTNL